jgi:hypothetical protein
MHVFEDYFQVSTSAFDLSVKLSQSGISILHRDPQTQTDATDGKKISKGVWQVQKQYLDCNYTAN